MDSKKPVIDVTENAVATTSENKDVVLDEKTHKETEKEPHVQSDDYPKGFRFILITISLMLAVFMVALDTSVICE